MTRDRRSETSRANLGEHIPEALGDGPSTVIAVRVPPELLAWIDRLRGDATRSEFLRGAAEQAIDFARHPMSYSALALDEHDALRDAIADLRTLQRVAQALVTAYDRNDDDALTAAVWDGRLKLGDTYGTYGKPDDGPD